MWDNCALFNHHYPILNGMGAIVAILKLGAAVDLYVVTYVCIFVDNSIFNITPVAYAHNWRIGRIGFLNLFKGLVVITAHYIAIFNSSAYAYAGTNTNYRPCDMAGADDTTIGNYSFVYMCTAHF